MIAKDLKRAVSGYLRSSVFFLSPGDAFPSRRVAGRPPFCDGRLDEAGPRALAWKSGSARGRCVSAASNVSRLERVTADGESGRARPCLRLRACLLPLIRFTNYIRSELSPRAPSQRLPTTGPLARGGCGPASHLHPAHSPLGLAPDDGNASVSE